MPNSRMISADEQGSTYFMFPKKSSIILRKKPSLCVVLISVLFFIACRSTKKYAYENLITRETQFDKPEEDDDDDEEEEQDVKKSDETKTESNSKNQENPPLPPEEKEKNPPLPPPPPEISLPPLPASQNQVEDMDLSEDETEIPPIETPKEPPTKDAADPLSNALSSFYSDIAGIDGSSQETTPVPTPPKVNSPSPSLGRESPGLSDERSNSPFCGDSQDESKKRKVQF